MYSIEKRRKRERKEETKNAINHTLVLNKIVKNDRKGIQRYWNCFWTFLSKEKTLLLHWAIVYETLLILWKYVSRITRSAAYTDISSFSFERRSFFSRAAVKNPVTVITTKRLYTDKMPSSAVRVVHRMISNQLSTSYLISNPDFKHYLNSSRYTNGLMRTALYLLIQLYLKATKAALLKDMILAGSQEQLKLMVSFLLLRPVKRLKSSPKKF